MKIYGHRTFGNPRRVAIFLEEKGLEVEFEGVDLRSGEHQTEAFRRKNPVAQVPVLELDDGTTLAETMAICRYFEELHPEPCLFGADPLERARIEMWQRRVEFGLYQSARFAFRHSSPLAKALEPVQIPEWAELNRERAAGHARILDAQLAGHPYLAGERFSVADITAIFVLQGLGAMAGIEIPADCEGLARWQAEVAKRPSVVSTLPAAR